MGKAGHLTEIEIGKIKGMKEGGNSIAEIARTLKRSRNAVANCIKRGMVPAVRKGGPKVKIGERVVRRIGRHLTSKTVTSLRQLKKDLGLSCHISTLHRKLRCGAIARFASFKKVPALSTKHREARLKLALDNACTDWNNVIFSDEKRFCLASDNNLKYWHCSKESTRRFIERSQGDMVNGFMVWIGISVNGLLPLKIFESGTRVYSLVYQSCLAECLVPYVAPGMLFQQDNCSVHVSRSTMAWLESKKVDVIGWPSISPDLNPVENVWAYMSRHMYDGGISYATKADLRAAIQDAFDSIKDDTLLKLFEGMPRRMMQVAMKRGGPIDY